MKIQKVSDVTTRESAITHEITMRFSVWDFKKSRQDFSEQLVESVVKAIDGIGDYPISFDEIQTSRSEQAAQG